MSKTEIEEAFHNLNDIVQETIKLFTNDYNFQSKVYPLWTAKDVLGHLVFWHESFARNISDLGNNLRPNPLIGKLSEVNQESVNSTKNTTIEELIERFQQAQNTIQQHIYNEYIHLIPYKKGSRDYGRLEHVQIVTNHINKHLKDLKKLLG